MNTYFEQINRILAEWNPIGVSDEIAMDEYKGYIPLILRSLGTEDTLFRCLEDILLNKMEVGYDPAKKEHSEDLRKVCSKIYELMNKTQKFN